MPAAENVSEMGKRGATLEELSPFISGKQGKKLLDTGILGKRLLGIGRL